MKNIIKLLMKFDSFRAGLLKAAFETQFKPIKNVDRMKYVLSDSKGVKYYEYIKSEWLPLPRYEQMQTRLLEIESKIGRESLLMFSEVIKKLAQKNDLIGVARMAGELEERLNLLYDPEIMCRFICGLLIREDQIDSAEVWNQQIENEKFKQLMADNENGNLGFFFQQTGLERYLKFSSSSGLDWETLMNEQMIQFNLQSARLFDQMNQKVSTSLSPK